MIERMMMAGGGTGGHLFPGIAVVEELRRRLPDVDVRFVGTERGLESRVLPAMGERVEFLDVTPLKGRPWREMAAGVARLPAAWSRAVTILRRARPDVVLGVGGYASGPMLVAAASLGIPCALLEQNTHVGLTNRLLAHVVGRAYVAFSETAEIFGERARVVGNPVRREFVEAARRAQADPKGFDARAKRILVLGGSQGAKRLNQVVPRALAALGADVRGLAIMHQTGAAMLEEVEASYAHLGIAARVVPFIDDVARAYASASLVICRAGASTLAELAAIGRPAILIPYPFAADDHQGKNAESFARAGAALCMREHLLEPSSLAAAVRSLLDDAPRRAAMAQRMRARGRPEAAASIVDDLLEWLGRPRRATACSPTANDVDGERIGSVDRVAQQSGARTGDGAESASGQRARPRIDFRQGRAIRAEPGAPRSVPRLLVEPYVARRDLATAN